MPVTRRKQPVETRQRLVDAAVRLMLKQGFAGTTVDQICADAALTKGSFFHHFDSKEAICKAAIEWWANMGTSLYAASWADPTADPLDQLYSLLDIMAGLASRPDQPCLCLIGMMSQEVAVTHPDLRESCAQHLDTWTVNAERLIRAAKERHTPTASFDPNEVAWFLNSLWQGSMLVAKTNRNQNLISQNLRIARNHIDQLFIAAKDTNGRSAKVPSNPPAKRKISKQNVRQQKV